ncbi:hypothetical protein GCM10018793_34760 [Streptomyces sulfonofaciens]|uniref:Uncharacterized protein n=1 Tax=Streptomyces sulfonofaciens TaxID=68272 RepID=A0A919G8U4_9ACTN|nr:hypothetical protein [Streptomyces sulfonofaciens]GHH80198.1 hypothetical protein GCM10018793_34760 [Streptomyces sulfonofaciens]
MGVAVLTVATVAVTVVRTAVPRGLTALAHLVRTTSRVRPSRPSRRDRQAGGARVREGHLPSRGPRGAARREESGRGRPGPAGWQRARALDAMPRQVVPPTESVDLTPAERAAFAGLVRQFSEGRR